MKLTKDETKLLRYLKAWEETGESPSMIKIRKHMGYTYLDKARALVKALEDKGLIKVQKSKSVIENGGPTLPRKIKVL